MRRQTHCDGHAKGFVIAIYTKPNDTERRHATCGGRLSRFGYWRYKTSDFRETVMPVKNRRSATLSRLQSLLVYPKPGKTEGIGVGASRTRIAAHRLLDYSTLTRADRGSS